MPRSPRDTLKEGDSVMSNQATVAELFELAIAAEKAAEKLYRGLEAKFAHYQEVADFWAGYATEEAWHVKGLEHIRHTLNPEQLSAPADPSMLKGARRLLQFSTENALKEVRNLEDAYQLVHEFESSETNVIFEFLITNFYSDKKAQSFLRSQLKDHIAKLITEFPTQFKHTAKRRAIGALEVRDS
jgi:rubrerythrin